MSAKNNNLEVIKPRQQNLPLLMKPACPPSLLGNRAQIQNGSSTHRLETGGSDCTIPNAAPPRRLPKVLWVNEVNEEPALSMTGSNGASSLSLSHLSNIIPH